MLAYGQTGSGKTFTMEGLEERIARDIFSAAHTAATRLLALEANHDAEQDAADMFEISVSFLELLGKRATDLVEQGDSENPVRKEVAINEDKVC